MVTLHFLGDWVACPNLKPWAYCRDTTAWSGPKTFGCRNHNTKINFGTPAASSFGVMAPTSKALGSRSGSIIPEIHPQFQIGTGCELWLTHT